MLCITERKYVTLIGSKIFLAKHLLFLLLCKICLFFLNKGHQAHVTWKSVTPDLSGGECFYNKLSTDLMFLKPWASNNRAPSAPSAVLIMCAFTRHSLSSGRTEKGTMAVGLGQAPPNSPCVGRGECRITSQMCKGPSGSPCQTWP